MRVHRLPLKGSYAIFAACDSRDRCMLLDFFNGLGPNLEKDMHRMLGLLEEVAANGPPRNTVVCHKIQGDIWEFIKGRLRVFWFADEGRIIVCTHGIIKKSNKTPKEDIAQAVRIHEQYRTARKRGYLEVEVEEEA